MRTRSSEKAEKAIKIKAVLMRRKAGPVRKKPESLQKNITKSERPEKKKKHRTGSMGRRISASYIQMMADAFLSCLIMLLIVYILFHSLMIGWDVRKMIHDLNTTDNLTEIIYHTVIQRDTEMALSDMSGEGILNTFGEYIKPHEMLPVWFYRKGHSIYCIIRTQLVRSEGLYELSIFKDITPVLIQMGILFGVAVFLGASVLLTIFFRGKSMTRNVLYPIAEMTRMTREIKAQNLNLRLNVTNAKDELKDMVVTFNEMMDRIEDAYNKQNRFVSDASHELRTPISVVQGYARMLERWGKEDPAVLAESIEAIRNESENMKELVDKLLFIARNDKDTLILTREDFSLSEMMDELVKETRMVDENHTIESSIDQGIKLNGDRNRIKQAMRIFVDNAQKYTEPEDTIEIKLTTEGDMAIMSVKDTGCGIPLKDLNSVFDRFYRADESRDRNKGGHGLGLSIARIIILRHGGKIKVRSKVGEGSTFSILLRCVSKASVSSNNSHSNESKNLNNNA